MACGMLLALKIPSTWGEGGGASMCGGGPGRCAVVFPGAVNLIHLRRSGILDGRQLELVLENGVSYFAAAVNEMNSDRGRSWSWKTDWRTLLSLSMQCFWGRAVTGRWYVKH